MLKRSLFAMGGHAFAVVVSLFLLSGCTKTEKAAFPDGYLIKISVASNFNRALVDRVRIVIDKSRFGQALGLGASTSVTTTISESVTLEGRIVSIDADSDTEDVIEALQNPFTKGTSFQLYLASPGHATRSFSVSVSFVSSRFGTIGSIVKDQLPNGELLAFAAGKQRELSFEFSCDAKISCLADGGANQPPSLGNVAPATVNVRAGSVLRINVANAATDRDGDRLTFAAFGEPMDAGVSAATIDPLTGLFTWTPTSAHVRDAGWGVTFSVSDPTNAAVTKSTTIVVRADNSDPVWSPVAETFAVEGQTISIPVSVYDPDNETVAVSLNTSGLPSGANAAVAMDGGDGTFTWTPTSKDSRTNPYTVRLTARDGFDASAVLEFAVNVVNVNDLPVIAAPESLTLKAGATTVLAVTAVDPDGEQVTLGADFTGFPSGFTWSGTADPATTKSGNFTWTPNESDVRSAPYVATFTAVDTSGGATVSLVNMTVTSGTGGNAAPTLSGPPVSLAEEGKLLGFNVTATDPEGTAVVLAMDAGGFPAGNSPAFTVDGGAGAFSWTPAAGTARSDVYRVTFRATDTANASTNLDLFILVSAAQADAGGATDGGGGGADAGDAGPGCPGIDAGIRLAPNGVVNAIAQVGCTLYLGGDFTAVGPITGGGAPLNSSTGALASGIPTLLAVGTVNAVAPDDAGGWYIGGSFSKVGNTTRNNLARINADGTLNAWNPNAQGNVNALVVVGSTVYVGGEFITIGFDTRNRLAAIGTDGFAQSWDPRPNGFVHALAVSGSTIYVGGEFTTLDGGTTSRSRLAAIGTDGIVQAWNPSADSTVNALAVSGSTVYAGGQFASFGGGATFRNNVAAIDGDGGILPWNPDVNNSVLSLAVSGAAVYAGGTFTTIGGTARNRVAAIDTDGGLLAWNPSADNTVNALAVSGSTVYVGGSFSTLGGGSRSLVGAVDFDGGLLPFDPSLSGTTVKAIAVSGSQVYVGGSFQSLAGTPRSRLAAFGTDGVLQPWNPNANLLVKTLAASGSTIYVGGVFTTVSGVSRNSLAAIDTDGGLLSWNPNANVDVNAIVVSGSTVYAGGIFTTLDGGTARNRLAAIGTDGVIQAWNPNANLPVNALAVSGGVVYAGGNFTTMGGTTRNSLAAIDFDGGLLAWNPNADGPISALTVSGSTVYVGGNFASLGGVTRNDVAAIGTDGVLQANWNPNVNGTAVNAIAVSGSNIHLGGFYSLVGGVIRFHLAAVGTDGVLQAWDPNAGSTVRALLVSGSTIYAGGDFLAIGGQTYPYFAPIDSTTGQLK